MSSVISVKDLSYRYGAADPLVLCDLNFDVQAGEFVTIMGPSGAGKTTLCLALNGIIPNFFGGKFYGRVNILGQDTLDLSVAELAQNIGMVLQDPEMQLVTNSVEDEIAFGLENIKVPSGEMRSRIDEALRIVRLTGYESKHPARLSGGQKQRLAIAAALALRPKVMVLDEPTSQLDPIGVEEVFSVIRELNQRLKMTVMLVTHDSERAAEFADRVLLMEEGQIIQDQSPHTIFQNIDLQYKAAVRLPQVTQFFAGFNQQVHLVSTLPTNLPAAKGEMERLWPEVDFKCRTFPEIPIGSKNTGEPVISAQNLSFTYPDGTQALTDISLEIRRGECVAIIGQNGGGKSTLVKHFVRLLKPTAGEVKVFEKDVIGYTIGALARRIGFIYQNPDSQIFCKTVEEEVGFGPSNQLEDPADVKRRVETALEDMDLVQFRDEHPLALSKGDRERVAVAAVLAMEPEIVIFDEPTTGQDNLGAFRIMQMIERLHQQGRTVLIITHHLHLLPGYVDRVILLGDGKILVDAPLRQVFHNVSALRETYLSPPQIIEFVHELEKISSTELNALTVEETLNYFVPGDGTESETGEQIDIIKREARVS